MLKGLKGAENAGKMYFLLPGRDDFMIRDTGINFTPSIPQPLSPKNPLNLICCFVKYER